MKSFNTLLVSVLIAVNKASAQLPCFSDVNSSFKIYTVDAAKKRGKCKLHSSLASSLKSNGFTKVMCPFGILLVATTNYPDELLKYGANIVANLIDKDGNGIPDSPATKRVLAHMGKSGRGAALVCGNTRAEESKEENLSGLAYTFSCQTWKNDERTESGYKSIMFEEAFHMLNEGWAAVYPNQFGYDNFQDSVICRETARLQCVKPGWWHPENKCPNGAPFEPGNPAESPLPPLEGQGCTEPSCDCFEFFRQAATLYMGWTDVPFWYSPYMPSTKSDFLNMASDEFKAMMADETYQQPQSPLTGIYTKTTFSGNKKIRGTRGWSNAACKDRKKFRVNGNNCAWVAEDPGSRCDLKGARNACKKSCSNCPCNKYEGGGDDDNENDGGNDDGDGTNGEEACEGKGYNESQCLSIGNDCCAFEDGQCWSAIGREICTGL